MATVTREQLIAELQSRSGQCKGYDPEAGADCWEQWSDPALWCDNCVFQKIAAALAAPPAESAPRQYIPHGYMVPYGVAMLLAPAARDLRRETPPSVARRDAINAMAHAVEMMRIYHETDPHVPWNIEKVERDTEWKQAPPAEDVPRCDAEEEQ